MPGVENKEMLWIGTPLYFICDWLYYPLLIVIVYYSFFSYFEGRKCVFLTDYFGSEWKRAIYIKSGPAIDLKRWGNLVSWYLLRCWRNGCCREHSHTIPRKDSFRTGFGKWSSSGRWVGKEVHEAAGVVGVKGTRWNLVDFGKSALAERTGVFFLGEGEVLVPIDWCNLHKRSGCICPDVLGGRFADNKQHTLAA